MFYGEDIINEVREKNDIVDVISGYINLKRSGANYFGLCPFHGEKTASFSVNRSKQMFYCFGCHRGGSVISFVREYENCGFQEAVDMLAERAGILIEKREPTEQEKREQSRRARIMEINTLAARFYYYALREPVGEAGMRYFKGRGLTDETMHSFGLGFAPKSGGLIAYLKNKGYTDEEIIASGLASNSEKWGVTELFWNRVMFPIMNANRKVVGFGGRVMGDGKPKYINSPETPVYEKSRHLYGLFAAKQSREDYFILCEGYIDVIAMHQAGFMQAVASLGTAFNMNHANTIARYVKKVLLIYDSDDAGVQAALKVIPVLGAKGISCRIVSLKPHKDPDEFIKAEGAEAFAARLSEAENSLYFELRMLSRDYRLEDPTEKSAFIHRVATRLAGIEDDIERDGYIESVSIKYGVNRQLLERDVASAIARGENILIPSEPMSGIISRDRSEENGLVRSERYLLRFMAEEPSLFEQVSRVLEPGDFSSELDRKLAGLLFGQLSCGAANPAAIADDFAEEDEHGIVVRIFNDEVPHPEERREFSEFITDLVIRIKKNSLMNASENDDDGAVDPLEQIRKKREEVEQLDNIRITLP